MHRTALLTVVFAAVIAIASGNRMNDGLRLLSRHVRDLAFGGSNRVKRSDGPAGVIGNLASGNDTCLETCVDKMDNGTHDFGLSFGLDDDDEDADEVFTDPAELDKTCQSFNESKACFANCGTQYDDIPLLNNITVLQYMCVDHYAELKKYAPCYEKAQDVIEANCSCDDAFTLGDRIRRSADSDPNIDDVDLDLTPEQAKAFFSVFIQLFGGVCNTISCHQNCARPIMTDMCGTPDAAKIRDGVTAESMKSLIGVIETADLGTFPKVCHDVAQGKFEYKPPAPSA